MLSSRTDLLAKRDDKRPSAATSEYPQKRPDGANTEFWLYCECMQWCRWLEQADEKRGIDGFICRKSGVVLDGIAVEIDEDVDMLSKKWWSCKDVKVQDCEEGYKLASK